MKLALPQKEQSNPLIRSLMRPGCYDHPVIDLRLIETHISWVILTGAYAYKIKKPVNFGFLDFSTLEKRGLYCQEELRLNSRLAPSIYLEVLAITGNAQHPKWGKGGEIIEYALKMREFPQASQLDRMLMQGTLTTQHIDAFARRLAEFHQSIACADKRTDYGDPDHIQNPVIENFIQIRERIRDNKLIAILDRLQQWSVDRFAKLRPVFMQRKEDDFIRECHGDLHLRNLAWVDNAPVVFDCIEFNPNLRWIDVISDIAFLVMDLQDRNQPRFAQRLLNRYLEVTGDYAGLRLLPFYLCYRALVRAKVDVIRLQQASMNEGEAEQARRELLGYLRLAERYTQSERPMLIITHGPSASGKSTATQSVLERIGAIRIRSDVERKRLFGANRGTPENLGIGTGIYSTEATHKTYEKLVELASCVIDAGVTVIVDAVSMKWEERQAFQTLAVHKQVPYIILEFVASVETLRQRIVKREKGVSDADLAVLEMQLAHWTPLRESELSHAVEVNTDLPCDIDGLVRSIHAQSR